MKHLYCIALSLPLFACGGSHTNSNPPTTSERIDYSNLSSATLEPGSLRQASTQELSTLIKNGLRLSINEYRNYSMLIRETAITSAQDSSINTSDNFSTTNVQVAGVDEADSVKYDGKYIYLVTPTQYSEEHPSQTLKIFATDATQVAANELSETILSNDHWGDVSELYLVTENETTTSLAAIRRSWNFITFSEPRLLTTEAVASDMSSRIAIDSFAPYQMHNGINISLYDVRTPSNPAKTWSIAIDGDLLSTRKIGNTLYVVSSFVPSINELNYLPDTDQLQQANEKLIVQTPIEKLLPEYAINEGTPQLLTSTNGCLVPQNTRSTQGHLNLINITAIDLQAQTLVKSVCINTSVEGTYASLNNLYLGGSNDSNGSSDQSFSVIHKFSLEENSVNYSASGSVPGTLGWNAPSFRMDEYQDYLRLITTQYNALGLPQHQLSILKKIEGRSEMEIVAQLPNAQQPEPIGKPREDIYAVRFHTDKAYIVTFERKDPLYVLDLSNPLMLKISGQLQIPGYSTYLHPIGDKYLFSLGNETDENGRPISLKLALFDIQDMTNPIEIDKHLLGNSSTWSEALYDHRALSFLNASNDQVRITLPINLWEDVIDKGDAINQQWLNTSLYQFEINGLNSNKPSLDQLAHLISESNDQQEYPNWNGNDRGILHGNSVFYVHGDKVIASPWPIKK